MNRLILLVESRIRGDVYVRFGGELPKTHRSNTAGRWMLSLPLKSVNNLVKDAVKVRNTILMIGEISDIYVTNFQLMLRDENYTPEELSAIAFGYTKLLEESNNVLKEMKEVVNITTLSMSDKERMDVVDRLLQQRTAIPQSGDVLHNQEHFGQLPASAQEKRHGQGAGTLRQP